MGSRHDVPRLALRARLRAVPGYGFVELLVVSAMLLVLASAVLPLSKVTMQRQREAELRRALRVIRTAIDQHKDSVDLGLIGGADVGPAARATRRTSRRWSRASRCSTTPRDVGSAFSDAFRSTR